MGGDPHFLPAGSGATVLEPPTTRHVRLRLAQEQSAAEENLYAVGNKSRPDDV